MQLLEIIFIVYVTNTYDTFQKYLGGINTCVEI